MANDSNVWGTVSFSYESAAESKNENIGLTVDILSDLTANWYYGDLSIDGLTGDMEAGAEYDFSSVGRWSFFNSIESYFESIDRKIDKDFGPNANSIKRFFEGLVINFDYTDLEPGSEYFARGHGDIECVLENGKLKTISCISVVDIDFTAQNLMEIGFEDQAWDSYTIFGLKRLLLEYCEDKFNRAENGANDELSEKIARVILKDPDNTSNSVYVGWDGVEWVLEDSDLFCLKQYLLLLAKYDGREKELLAMTDGEIMKEAKTMEWK